MLLLWKVEKLKVSDKTFECKNPKCMKKYPQDPGSCKLNKDEAAQIQYEKENPQEQQEQEEPEQQEQQAQDEQDEQEVSA